MFLLPTINFEILHQPTKEKKINTFSFEIVYVVTFSEEYVASSIVWDNILSSPNAIIYIEASSYLLPFH